MISDANKKISSIAYNHLNLPSLITITGKGTIAYTYDAAGTKLKKVVTDNTVSPSKVTTTLYLASSVYENDVLQFIGMEEGRIRLRPSDGNFQFDYMLKDHLGNVRALITEESKTDSYPAASMETATATTEEALYSNLPGIRTDAPVGYGGGTPQKVARVKAASGSKQIGPAIVLKVMAGDHFNLSANSWWKSLSSPGTPVNPFTDLLAALTGSVGGITSTHGGATTTQLQTGNILDGAATDFINSRSYDNTKPKAYVSWVLLDEQFKFVAGNSGVEQVDGNNTYKTHTRTNMPIDKNGYLYIYTSNETPNIDVYFDNLQVTHIRGQLLEETHYYPFGLTMAGLSSKALAFGEPVNKKNKFQDQELNSDFDVNYYEFKWRYHDPQIGRFIQIDPLSDKYRQNSTYAFSENKVIGHIELEGLEAVDIRYYAEKGIRQTEPNASEANIKKVMEAWDHGRAQGGYAGLRTAKAVAIGALVVFQPEIGIPLAVGDLTGVPVSPSPQAMSGTLAAEVGSAATASDEIVNSVSLATKARVFEAGGEIGMMDGAATLAVDAKTGFFNVQVTSGIEKGIITGELNINRGAIEFINLEITNAKGGLGSISQQNTIGPSTFLQLQKEMAELSRAGGYNKATVEFSRLRPIGSKLLDSETRSVTLFDNTHQ